MNNITRGLITCFLAIGLALTVPLALTVSDDVFAAPGGGGGKPPKPESRCEDNKDNDGDGLIDCDDPDCDLDPVCTGGGEAGDPKNQFNILMNYELGMHCTGFEFSYCCVLPPYNSIIAQVVKTQKGGNDFPRLLEADDTNGLDFLGRPTVLRDKELNGDNFKKYMLKYSHDAQDRSGDPNGKPQTSTLISLVEGNSLLMWNTIFDAADVDAGNALQYTDGAEGCSGPLSDGTTACDGSIGVIKGDGNFNDSEDNYANAWLNHFYIYEDLEGSNSTNTSAEDKKIRLGLPNALLQFPTVLPDNSGPAFHPMGPGSTAGLDNVLTWSTDHGTVVFTQMKVLENLPVMLTSPRIWEALGLPLTPFEDSIDFFGDPGAVDEDSIRPYVFMRAQLHEADCVGTTCTPGVAVLDGGVPVTGFGTAPIDIPNCERCHSAFGGQNAGNASHPLAATNTQLEIDFWNSYYGIGPNDSDWYSRLKGAAISMLTIHDIEHGTSFMANYPVNSGIGIPQNYRSGHESVICQRCHADNVIAVVKSAACGPDNINCAAGDLIPPLTEAIHYNHRNTTECENPSDPLTCGPIVFDDSHGRDGGCQGCHPAHRSDGSLAGYPITEDGDNAFAAADNRDAAGGCFVGRDVHSNPSKDIDGVETVSHLNPVGTWLQANVYSDPSPDGDSGKGIWCTNCHSQLGQELWKAENVVSLVHASPGDPGHVREPFAGATLADVAFELGITENQAISWLDPKTTGSADGVDNTHAVWALDPGLCDYVASVAGAQPFNPAQDGNVAVVEVLIGGSLGGGGSCSNAADPSAFFVPVDCGFVTFDICGSTDGDGDFNVNLVGNTEPDAGGFGGAFCTTPDCVGSAQASLGSCTLAAGDKCAVPVPMSAATDGRDHWLAPGEPHCADCHAAPYVEQSGNVNAFPPFNYPRKASLMRYSRGHQDITCQGCHESSHGLYPVTALIDTTSYAQAESMNTDGSHGPLNCTACHTHNAQGVYVKDDNRINNPLEYQGRDIADDFDDAASWAHTFTDDVDVRDYICERCHTDNTAVLECDNGKWADHTRDGRVSRDAMDKAELATLGYICGDVEAAQDPYTTVCTACHGNRKRTLERKGCSNKWRNHLIEGRSSEKVWEYISEELTQSTCGW